MEGGKEKVDVVAKDGKIRTYTVNPNGYVNAASKTFLEGHGGCVGRGVPVKTPLSCGLPKG